MADLKPTIRMESRSTQTDPDPEPPRRTFANNAPEDSFLEEPLGYTAIDPYGRRSMAFRRKATGEIVTQTELDEATIEGQAMQNFFRRQDACMCFLLMENIESKRLRDFFGFLALVFLMVPWLGYSNLMVHWDMKMEERRKRSQAEEKEK